MRLTKRIESLLSTSVPAPARTLDVSGLVAQREQAVRALQQTREARKSGELERIGESAVKELESSIAGVPDTAEAGFAIARVVASGDAKAGLPAVPLSGLTTRLKIKEKVEAEDVTNAFGLVTLPLPKETEGSYELEVLAPDCTLLACQPARWTPKRPAAPHLFELARTENLKPHVERAQPLEEGIRQARARATLARDVMVKALEAQETRLVEYLAEIDAALAREPPDTSDKSRPPPPRPNGRPETAGTPVIGKAGPPREAPKEAPKKGKRSKRPAGRPKSK